MDKESEIIKTQRLPLKIFFWNNNSPKTVVFIGGSGDDRSKLIPLIENLHKSGLQHNFLTFSFRGIEEEDFQPLKQQVNDLVEVFDWALENLSQEIIFICTSMGAYSAVHLLVNELASQKISIAVFIDPADYYLSDAESDGEETWTGNDNYAPQEKTISSLMQEVNSNTKVHVINFLLRNYTSKGYVAPDKRHLDNPENVERLNNAMVKSFYTNTPDKNKGKYIESSSLPHAIMRDGEIEKNISNITDILIELLK